MSLALCFVTRKYQKEFWQTEVFEEKLSQGNLFGASDRRQWICPNVLR